MRTVIGLFDDRDEAMRAYTALHNEGYALADLDILTNDDRDDEPKLAGLHRIVPEPDVNVYLEGVRQGGSLVTANVADSVVSRAAEIMSGFNMVKIGERAETLRTMRSDLQLSDPRTDDNVLEVIEEDLSVGKNEVERGRMRIYSVVSERAVEEQVGLRDETIRVQRRPVNRSATINPDLFKERSFEMVEIDEIATVSKSARVVEEVVLGKDVTEKVEVIRETLRRQDVEIEEVPAVRPYDEYHSDFNTFYTQHLQGSGLGYERFDPAFRYGYSLATREPFRSSPWKAVEADARRIWEEKNPGTWAENKAIVKYAWERVRSAR